MAVYTTKRTAGQMQHQEYFAQLLCAQLVMLLLASGVLRLACGFEPAGAFYCGAVAYWLPSAFCGWLIMQGDAMNPAGSVLRLVSGEIAKIALTIGLLWFALLHAALPLLWLLSGYILTLLSICFIPGLIRRWMGFRAAVGNSDLMAEGKRT